MKIIEVGDPNCLAVVTRNLLAGKVIFYPTDTIYGLGCLAEDSEAVEKLYQLKERPGHQPSLILINSFEVLRECCVVSPEQEKYLHTIWPGPVTVILQGLGKLPAVSGYENSLAVRMPNNDWLQALLSALKKPLVSTSANISGTEPAKSLINFCAQFKNNLPHLAIDAGPLNGQPSKLIDLRDFPELKIIRD